jgi:peptide chain release factor 2
MGQDRHIMRDVSDDISALRKRHAEAAQYLKIEEFRARRPQLEAEASRPDLWDDADRARQVTGELSAVTDDLELYDAFGDRIDDVETLAELAREEGDDSVSRRDRSVAHHARCRLR